MWRDVVTALEAGRPHPPPRPPPGVEQRRVTFADAREPPRREWFVRGTAQTLVAAVPAAARRPRITNPAAGSVYALDPDVPIDRQRLAVAVSGDAGAHRVVLDGRALGAADTRPLILPGPGLHRLLLVDVAGRVVDQVRFTMR